MTQKNNEKYIKKCIKLAIKGEGKVSPNPLVGSVILDKIGKIAGYGWHQKYGEAHAEVNAVKMAKEKGIDIKGGTIFVSLEPCSHFGKTPPCCDLIIKEGLKKAVIGCVDPNPIVSGRGIQKLKDAGIEVVTGILENECKKLNEIFIKNQLDNKPFIAIKTASTLDGKIATKNGSSKWITTEKARKHVQKLRNKYDAILTGSGTVIADNPSLTARIKNGTNPIRVIIDSNGRTSAESKVFNNDGTKVFLAVFAQTDTSKYPENVEIIKCPKLESTGKIDLQFLTRKLYEKGVRSILVEAGGTLNGAFIKEKLADKLYQFIAAKILGDKDGKNFAEGFDISDINNCVKLNITNVKMFNQDILIEADFLVEQPS